MSCPIDNREASRQCWAGLFPPDEPHVGTTLLEVDLGQPIGERLDFDVSGERVDTKDYCT